MEIMHKIHSFCTGNDSLDIYAPEVWWIYRVRQKCIYYRCLPFFGIL